MVNECLEWVNFAENDILTAETMSKLSKPPMEIVCYHCQQAAEKLLKAYLVLKNEPVLKTHDTVFLNSKCVMFDKSFDKINNECIRLTNYGVNTRYPNLMDIIENDMDIALKDISTIKSFVIKKLENIQEDSSE